MNKIPHKQYWINKFNIEAKFDILHAFNIGQIIGIDNHLINLPSSYCYKAALVFMGFKICCDNTCDKYHGGNQNNICIKCGEYDKMIMRFDTLCSKCEKINQ